MSKFTWEQGDIKITKPPSKKNDQEKKDKKKP